MGRAAVRALVVDAGRDQERKTTFSGGNPRRVGKERGAKSGKQGAPRGALCAAVGEGDGNPCPIDANREGRVPEARGAGQVADRRYGGDRLAACRRPTLDLVGVDAGAEDCRGAPIRRRGPSVGVDQQFFWRRRRWRRRSAVAGRGDIRVVRTQINGAS